MKDALAKSTYLSEYSPSEFLIDSTELHFTLSHEATTVAAKLTIKRNPQVSSRGLESALVLDGSANIELHSIKLNGKGLLERPPAKLPHSSGDHG